MSVFLDSSALIAYHRDSDENHSRAREIINKIVDKKIRAVISSNVLEEIVTFIASRDGPQKAYDVARILMQLQNMDIIWMQRKNVENALQVLHRFSGLSLCDALTATLMDDYGVQELVSFDSDFDQFKHIQRIY